MHEIYPRWVAAHGIMIITPVYWYQAPSVLKLMIDRMVCADGGNPDPTTTHGKQAAEAKAIEMQGWNFPRHLAGRSYSVVVHGDSAGTEELRRALSDWLNDMHLIQAGADSCIDRYIDYFGKYAASHDAFDQDAPLHEEVRNAARSLIAHVAQWRSGVKAPDENLHDPRPK
jgi:multimeric flavodoxin WrbA